MDDASEVPSRKGGKMRWRSTLRWTPLRLCVLLFGTGCALVGFDLSTPEIVILGGTADGAQVGMPLVICGSVLGVVALLQAVVLAGRMESGVLRASVRVAAALLLVLSIPAGCMMVFLTAFTAVNEYRPLDVPGHDVVVRTFSWHHRSYQVLEGTGVLFHTVVVCGDLPIDASDPFASGDYHLEQLDGRDVLTITVDGPTPKKAVALLGPQPRDEIGVVCAGASE